MKYLFDNLPDISEITKLFKGYLVMFDFDGTISPLAPTPSHAYLPKIIKKRLQEASKCFPVAIISGRSLSDIRNKIRLKNLIYAGNHGLEWQMGGKTARFPIPKKTTKLLLMIRQGLNKIEDIYPGVLLEHKGLSLSIHYRQLACKSIFKFKKDVIKIITSSNSRGSIEILEGKKVVELRPNLNWNKGKFALFILKYLQKKFKYKLLPIYIGDDTTDEDAFAALTAGITIRVGTKRYSQAKYYIKNTRQTALLMRWLIDILRYA